MTTHHVIDLDAAAVPVPQMPPSTTVPAGSIAAVGAGAVDTAAGADQQSTISLCAPSQISPPQMTTAPIITPTSAGKAVAAAAQNGTVVDPVWATTWKAQLAEQKERFTTWYKSSEATLAAALAGNGAAAQAAPAGPAVVSPAAALASGVKVEADTLAPQVPAPAPAIPTAAAAPSAAATPAILLQQLQFMQAQQQLQQQQHQQQQQQMLLMMTQAQGLGGGMGGLGLGGLGGLAGMGGVGGMAGGLGGGLGALGAAQIAALQQQQQQNLLAQALPPQQQQKRGRKRAASKHAASARAAPALAQAAAAAATGGSGGVAASSSATRSSKPKKPVERAAATNRKKARYTYSSDGTQHTRPRESYAELAFHAIKSCANQRATVREIYDWVEEKYPFYKHEGAVWWKNCIRHNLSMKPMFIRHADAGGPEMHTWSVKEGLQADSAIPRRRRSLNQAQSAEEQSYVAAKLDATTADALWRSTVPASPAASPPHHPHAPLASLLEAADRASDGDHSDELEI